MPTKMRPDLMANQADVLAWHDNFYVHTTPETSRKAWRHFRNQQDPYNPDNFITGWVQMLGGDQYGTLIIEEINERPTPQRIAATPKAAYPYHRDRSWLLQNANWVRSATKYDGTNICQFTYLDADQRPFTTFKVRTKPHMPSHFRVMLDACLKRYPAARDYVPEPGEAMIYELYGRQNPQLIIYDDNIELRALCRRNPLTQDLEPADPEHPAFAQIDCPLADATLPAAWPDTKAEYAHRQDTHESALIKVMVNGMRAYHGTEGEMLYVNFPDGARSQPGSFTRLIKLKPHQIEEIHQELDHVPKEEAEATARNAWEISDNPTIDDLITLLQEEWHPEQIQRSIDTLHRVIKETHHHRHRENQIVEIFLQHCTTQEFRQNPAAAMRRLQGKYPREIMQHVFTVLTYRLPLQEHIP